MQIFTDLYPGYCECQSFGYVSERTHILNRCLLLLLGFLLMVPARAWPKVKNVDLEAIPDKQLQQQSSIVHEKKGAGTDKVPIFRKKLIRQNYRLNNIILITGRTLIAKEEV